MIDPHNYSAVETFTEIYSTYPDAFDRIPAQVRSIEWMIGRLPPQARVLDVGCGTGKPVCELLANAGFHVTGIDITPKMIEIARSKVPGPKYVVADSRSWEPDEADDTFDGVVSYFAFIAAVSQKDIRDFFHRAYRWLRPGGLLVFGTVPIDGEHVAIKWLGRDVVVSSLSVDQNMEAIQKAGFIVERHEVETYMPRAAEVGICKPEDVWEEEHFYVYGKKPE